MPFPWPKYFIKSCFDADRRGCEPALQTEAPQTRNMTVFCSGMSKDTRESICSLGLNGQDSLLPMLREWMMQRKALALEIAREGAGTHYERPWRR